MTDNPKCTRCFYYRRLKNKFELGKGYNTSYCCVRYANEIGGFVLEVDGSDYCENFIYAVDKEAHNDIR